ncbi:transcriptional regulator of nitric oxide reductase [Rhodococcus sp. 27YEA15]
MSGAVRSSYLPAWTPVCHVVNGSMPLAVGAETKARSNWYGAPAAAVLVPSIDRFREPTGSRPVRRSKHSSDDAGATA